MNLAESATVSDVLQGAAERLAAAGCETPRLDAEVLLASSLGWKRADLVIRAREVPAAVDDFWPLLERRCAREPVAYIIGRREFRRIELLVDRRVLIPRPETELLVEVGLGLNREARVVDVGTGSGAVALALADERSDLAIVGTDVSADALAVATANAERLGLRVRFARGDLLAGEPADAVLANLPYVEEGSHLPPEISRYEPADALFAGPDGLAMIRRLVAQLHRVPMVALEIGAGQADAASALLAEQAGFRSIDRLRDLGGIERVVVGRR